MARHQGQLLPRGYRIGTVLILLAVVPLIGASWFAAREVIEVRAESRRVEEIDAAVRDLVVYSELRTRLLDELNWVAAAAGMEMIGLPADLAADLTGVDVPAHATDAAERVDSVVAMTEIEGLPERIAEIRKIVAVTGTEELDEYRELETELAALADACLEGVLASASEVSDSGPLIEGLQVLEAATVARQALSAEFNSYFEAQFSDVDSRADELRELVGESRIRLDSLQRVDRLARAGSAVIEALQTIRASEAAMSFDDEVRRFASANMTGDADPDALSVSSADLSEVAGTFTDSNEAAQLYFELVDAAGSDVHAATERASAAAARRNTISLVALVGLAVGTIAIGFATTRAIARPVRQLADVARAIRDGRSEGHSTQPSGPLEVREAAFAIDEAKASLALAERQALAMADGDLAHVSLAETGSGALGASLQSAVRTLTASLHEREELRKRMSHEANHDGLTQLPNRNASLTHLRRGVKRATELGTRLAVLFVDLDGFKEVNDELGHQAGDAVLRVVADRLAAAVSPDDHLGRVGGDEFVIIADPVADEHDALQRAAALHVALEKPVFIDSIAVRIGASIGVALSSGSSGTASDLLREADLALYRAKELGRDRTQICDDSLRADLAGRAALEQALNRALTEDEFVLHFQPIVDSHRTEVVAQEALVRWDRPGHGLVPPDQFIPFAERSELIIQIDRWVTRAVTQQIAEWDALGMPAIPVALNISGRHLASDDFVPNLIDAVTASEIDPTRLIVEITESALVEDLSSAALKLQHLRETGLRIAIDDFGTGYTSLAHLKRLPVDILKIDRSYVADESAVSLMKLIIDTGHLLGATVTAEGVETAEQAAALVLMGADELQGFYFGRPAPATPTPAVVAAPTS